MLKTWFMKRPNAEMVVHRVLCLAACLREAIAWPPPDQIGNVMAQWSEEERRKLTAVRQDVVRGVTGELKREGAWADASEAERKFITGDLTSRSQQEFLNAVWGVESLACCLWALSALDLLQPYDAPYAAELLERLKQVRLADARLRGHEELERERSIAELWHWRARTRQIIEEGMPLPPLPNNLTLTDVVAGTARAAAGAGEIPAPIGDDFPAFGVAYRDLSPEMYITVTSIAMERHKALNWICGRAPGHQWDRTPTDT